MQCDITMQVSSNLIDSELSFNQNPGPYAGVFRPSVWAAERVKKKSFFFAMLAYPEKHIRNTKESILLFMFTTISEICNELSIKSD